MIIFVRSIVVTCPWFWHCRVSNVLFPSLQMFSVIPRRFLPNVKNPCWYERLSGNISADPYRRNLYSSYSSQSRAIFQYLQSSFRKHLLLRNGKVYRIRCLPYFYIIGQPKCGTTDLYDRLRLHPDVRVTALKEPHWWTRKRFGRNYFFGMFYKQFSLDMQMRWCLLKNAHLRIFKYVR